MDKHSNAASSPSPQALQDNRAMQRPQDTAILEQVKYCQGKEAFTCCFCPSCNVHYYGRPLQKVQSLRSPGLPPCSGDATSLPQPGMLDRSPPSGIPSTSVFLPMETAPCRSDQQCCTSNPLNAVVSSNEAAQRTNIKCGPNTAHKAAPLMQECHFQSNQFLSCTKALKHISSSHSVKQID